MDRIIIEQRQTEISLIQQVVATIMLDKSRTAIPLATSKKEHKNTTVVS